MGEHIHHGWKYFKVWKGCVHEIKTELEIILACFSFFRGPDGLESRKSIGSKSRDTLSLNMNWIPVISVAELPLFWGSPGSLKSWSRLRSRSAPTPGIQLQLRQKKTFFTPSFNYHFRTLVIAMLQMAIRAMRHYYWSPLDVITFSNEMIVSEPEPPPQLSALTAQKKSAPAPQH